MKIKIGSNDSIYKRLINVFALCGLLPASLIFNQASGQGSCNTVSGCGETCTSCTVESGITPALDPDYTDRLGGMAGYNFVVESQYAPSSPSSFASSTIPVNGAIPPFAWNFQKVGAGPVDWCGTYNTQEQFTVFMSPFSDQTDDGASGSRYNEMITTYNNLGIGTTPTYAQSGQQECWTISTLTAPTGTSPQITATYTYWPDKCGCMNNLYCEENQRSASVLQKSKPKKNASTKKLATNQISKASKGSKLYTKGAVTNSKVSASSTISLQPPVLWELGLGQPPMQADDSSGYQLSLTSAGLCITAPNSRQTCVPLPLKNGVTANKLVLRYGNGFLYFTSGECPFNSFAQVGPLPGAITSVPQLLSTTGLTIKDNAGQVVWSSSIDFTNLNSSLQTPIFANDPGCALALLEIAPNAKMFIGTSLVSENGQYEFRMEQAIVENKKVVNLCMNGLRRDSAGNLVRRRQLWCETLRNERTKNHITNVKVAIGMRGGVLSAYFIGGFAFDYFYPSHNQHACQGHEIPLTSTVATANGAGSISENNLRLVVTDQGKLAIKDTASGNVFSVGNTEIPGSTNPFTTTSAWAPDCPYNLD